MNPFVSRAITTGAAFLLFAALPARPASPPSGKPASSSPKKVSEKRSEPPKGHVAGQQLFAEHCARCHTVDGINNMPGPDLSDYGTYGWDRVRVAAFIADAQLYLPGTRMPEFRSQLTSRQIDALAAYCNSLKNTEAYRMREDPPETLEAAGTEATTDVLSLDAKPDPTQPSETILLQPEEPNHAERP